MNSFFGHGLVNAAAAAHDQASGNPPRPGANRPRRFPHSRATENALVAFFPAHRHAIRARTNGDITINVASRDDPVRRCG
jgi:hypothetical protein